MINEKRSPYSVRIRENTEQKKPPYLDTFHTVNTWGLWILRDIMITKINMRYLTTDLNEKVVIFILHCLSLFFLCWYNLCQIFKFLMKHPFINTIVNNCLLAVECVTLLYKTFLHKNFSAPFYKVFAMNMDAYIQVLSKFDLVVGNMKWNLRSHYSRSAKSIFKCFNL